MSLGRRTEDIAEGGKTAVFAIGGAAIDAGDTDCTIGTSATARGRAVAPP
jgi:hypothetical protein